MRRNYREKYLKKMFENPLPQMDEDNRIYFEVPYIDRGFAKSCHCRFDPDKKLWYTGCLNRWLTLLVDVYDVSDQTSPNARKMLETALECEDYSELEQKVREHYEV